ncbi:ABC transporter substrate-binding protein [Nocardioides marmoriginsengisoli]|uniref:ABC transporter substrate-binding protein n=1 Tax=Nocardioides marmoriginsengisoli TaxID=661483 RepID=UPI0016228BDB|nr:ABC transporter substrate-binding protein [Nocardioides marmoriginsengisoli]
MSAAAFLSACGSNDSDSKDDGAKAAGEFGLPAKYVGGEVRIATSVGLAPYEVFGSDGKTIEGYEPDILAEIAKRLGVKLEWTAAKFETILPGVNAGRYDIAINGIFYNEERAAQFSLLNYFGDSSTMLVSKGNPEGITSIADLCGKNVAVQTGTIYPDAVEKLSKENCTDKGQPAMKLVNYNDAAGHVLLMKQGRADATGTARLVADYATHIGDSDFETVPGIDYDKATYAMVFKKNSDLVEPFQKALQSMIDDGAYAKIATEWGLSQSQITNATTEAPTP